MDTVQLTPRGLARTVGRAGAFAQNALEVARFGGLDTEAVPAPYEVVTTQAMYRLRRYFPEDAPTADRPPLLLIPPLMLTSEVYDVAPTSSAVTVLHEHGVAPWVIDFGAPEREEGGLARTLGDHVLAISEVIDRIRGATGSDVHVAGYSQGGMFAYQVAAYRRNEGIRSLVTFGSPVDLHRAIPFGLPEQAAARAAALAASLLFGGYAVPARVSRTVFKLLDPVKSVKQRIEFLSQLYDRESLVDREPQRRFLDGEGFVAWPGPALAEFASQFVQHNRLLEGGFTIGERAVTLADLECPVLCVVGESDEIAPADTVRALGEAAPGARLYEVAQPAGHFGMVVGGTAMRSTWPLVASWMDWIDGDGPEPEGIAPLREPSEERLRGPDLSYALGLGAGLALDLPRLGVRTVTRSARLASNLVGQVTGQLPALVRLQRLTPETRVSLGAVLDERAARGPADTFFLFEDRGYSYAAANARIDAVVRGLVLHGVRPGQHVGVCMATRPSALAVVVALSRIGAVAVLLRPDGEVDRELRLGEVERVVADPEHTGLVRGATGLDVLVLGGGVEERDLGPGVIDLERVDPDAVELPAWYTANPGRADDLAFVTFTGRAASTRVNRFRNRRWSLSAFGTAAAAALTPADTVYCVTPLHHPSALLVSIGGAVAAGSRIALTTGFAPETFWSEVRRYGVTVVSSTWTMCHALASAPLDPRERGHGVRLFVGSGMPLALWQRVLDRFAPAKVLEFYASSDGDVVLGNVRGEKVGAKGRPLPGSADVAVLRWDLERDRLVEGPDGLGQRCAVNEPGMLLARVDAGAPGRAVAPLRAVLAPRDAWVSTGDVFRVDADGDHWMLDQLAGMVPTASGLVATGPIEDALGGLGAVALVAAHGVAASGDHDLVVAAVVQREDRRVRARDLARALADLEPSVRPAVVHLVQELPTTTWHRVRKDELRAQGLPPASGWAWRRAGASYVRLDEAARERLLDD